MADLILYKDTPQILDDFANDLKHNLRLNLSARRGRYRYKSKFNNSYIADSVKRRRSTSKNNIASGKLRRSIDYKIYGTKIYLEFNEYGVMLDRGTDGYKLKQFDSDSLLEDADISYGNFDDMRSNINRWIKKRGLKLRERSLLGIGKALKDTPNNRKRLEFLITRSILNRGINATFWFTRPFLALTDKLPDDLIFGMHKSMDYAFDNIFKR